MSSPALPGEQPRLRWRRWAVALAGTVTLLAGLLAVALPEAPLPPPKILRHVQLTSDGQQKLLPDMFDHMTLVTDGGRLYFKTGAFLPVTWPSLGHGGRDGADPHTF